jgi:UDP-N-acetylglucosamine--N-acetylmuramyl-(pentapeptide) pyrophosphoryl-undecaprenol N-acetylglucosamine transferase
LFLGGSGGATFINDLSVRTIRALDELGRSVTATVVTGTDEYTRVREEVDQLAPRRVRAVIVPYEEHMERLYASSRVAVTRGGALALTELAVGGIYALTVPYPFAVGQHQTRNAAYVQGLGLGELFEQDTFDFDRFLTRLLRALDSDLGAAARYEGTVFGQDAGERIARTILEECGHG